jgi:lipid A 3-O-deacylase PagL
LESGVLRSRRSLSFLLVFCWLTGRSALAQAGELPPAFDTPLTRGTEEFGIWANYSPNSFVFDGTSRSRRLFLANLQYARTLLASRTAALKYTLELVPLALENQPTQFYLVKGKTLRNPAATIYGAGANPIGFEVNFGARRMEPFLSASLGFLYFAQQVPVVGSSQFNYTANLGVGIEIFSRSGRSFTVGYKYHHLSNAESAPLNPGLDSNMFYTGLSWLRGK